MKKSEIKPNLNTIVECNGTDYKLTAGIIRRKENGEDYYTVEIQDLKANSVSIARLDQVKLKEERSEK